MKEFFEKNKIFIAIIIAGFIIGGSIYLSKLNPPTASSSTSAGNSTASLITGAGGDSGCVDFKEARKFIGKNKCITGKVDNVYISSGENIFINFCPDYVGCQFRSVIFKSVSSKFPEPKQYEGKTVEISGFVKAYQDLTEIDLKDPSQIKVVK